VAVVVLVVARTVLPPLALAALAPPQAAQAVGVALQPTASTPVPAASVPMVPCM
jgi:hypothetical protein